MQITRAMAVVLADFDFEHPSERDAEQPAFASLADTTPVTNVFTAAHSIAEHPLFNTGFIQKKMDVHHSVFRFSCTTPDGQTHGYYMDFSCLHGHDDSHYNKTEAGRAKWARMMDVLPVSKVRTLPDGSRVPTSACKDAAPFITVSGDTTMHSIVYPNGGRRGSALIPANTPCVGSGATVRDLKDFAIDYLCTHGTYRMIKGRAGPRNVCGDFAVAAYKKFAGRRDMPKPFMGTKSLAWHVATAPAALVQARTGKLPRWYFRVQKARPLEKKRRLAATSIMASVASLAAQPRKSLHRGTVTLDFCIPRASSGPSGSITQSRSSCVAFTGPTRTSMVPAMFSDESVPCSCAR